MGVGKTTLTEILSKKLGWKPLYEEVAHNPYMDRFYEDMHRWGFNSQIFFLTQRLKQYQKLANRTDTILQDRSIYEDAEIFATNLHRQKNIPDDDFGVYKELYEAIKHVVPPPNLIIYLKASVDTLKQRIAKRGREFEQSISDEYLHSLNDLYDGWARNFSLCPVLTIETDQRNFVDDEKEVESVLGEVQKFIY